MERCLIYWLRVICITDASDHRQDAIRLKYLIGIITEFELTGYIPGKSSIRLAP